MPRGFGFIAVTLLAALLVACGAHGSSRSATAAPTAPTSAEVARILAHDPAFIEAVAHQVVANVQATSISIPVSAPADAGAAVSLTVAIDASGVVLFQGRPTTDAALATEIRTRVAASPQLRAVIAADRRVAHERVIQVIDLMRREGVTRFAMAVAPQ